MITICPECGEESLEVNVTGGGTFPSQISLATVHWFEGDGKCECGFEGYVSDTSE